jgi:hypothetical protein
MTEAMIKQVAAIEAMPQFPKDMIRELARRRARREAKMASPEAAIPMIYSTKVASRAMLSLFRPSWISEGQSMSERLMCKGPISSSSLSGVTRSKWTVGRILTHAQIQNVGNTKG